MVLKLVYSFVTSLFTIYGIYIAFLFIKFVIYERIIVRFLKTPVNLKESGQWAVVTGCTEGIGKAFVHELAKIGMDVILISRSKSKLDSLAEKLGEKYNVKTKIIVADFTNIDTALPEIEKGLDGMDIGVTVNNVGITAGIGPFLDGNKKEIMDIIEVNVKGTIGMCSVVLPNMIKKKNGIIINSSSVLAELPSPHTRCYGPSKAFIKKFSEDLNKEYKRSGITVHCLTPAMTRTRMTNVMTIPGVIPTTKDYVRSALKTVGISAATTGYATHDIIECFLKFFGEISESQCTNFIDLALRLTDKFVSIPSTASEKIKQ